MSNANISAHVVYSATNCWSVLLGSLFFISSVSLVQSVLSLASAHLQHFSKVDLAGIFSPFRRELQVLGLLWAFEEPAFHNLLPSLCDDSDFRVKWHSSNEYLLAVFRTGACKQREIKFLLNLRFNLTVSRLWRLILIDRFAVDHLRRTILSAKFLYHPMSVKKCSTFYRRNQPPLRPSLYLFSWLKTRNSCFVYWWSAINTETKRNGFWKNAQKKVENRNEYLVQVFVQSNGNIGSFAVKSRATV